MKQSLATVVSNVKFRPGEFLMWLDCPDVAAAAKPGQFVMVRCGGETLLRRPLSIHLVNEARDRLALLFAIVGKGTRWLSEREPGDKVDVFGPLGNGFSFQPGAKNVLLVAGGMGIAPLGFLAEEAIRQGLWVKLCEGTTKGEQLYGFKPDASALKFRISDPYEAVATTLVGSPGTRQGSVTDLICVYASWTDQVFACGPMAMYRTMGQMPELRGKPTQISLETTMACGFGVCYGCTIKTKSGLKQVCKDGPVFNLEDIIW